MTAYVIRDKIQPEKKSSPTQNSIQNKNSRKIFFCQKKFLLEKNCLKFWLELTVTKESCLGQVNAYPH